ncbi:hypothetical protein GCM10028815_10590 [Mariniluteicoccus flavus]
MLLADDDALDLPDGLAEQTGRLLAVGGLPRFRTAHAHLLWLDLVAPTLPKSSVRTSARTVHGPARTARWLRRTHPPMAHVRAPRWGTMVRVRRPPPPTRTA